MHKNIPLLLIITFLLTSCGKELEYNNTTTSAAANVFAGSGSQGSANATGTAASFYNPTGVATDAAGNVYVADYRNNMIRKITPAGVVTTFAGNGMAGAANGTGTNATFNLPTGVAVDASGNVYVADGGNNLIREISPAGVVTTLAGSGTAGAANGTGAAAWFNYPQGVTVDVLGNVYVADCSNNLIREISPAGVVTTLAGNGTQGLADGAATAAEFNQPTGIAVDASFNVYVADFSNNMIREISPAGVVTTIAGSGTNGLANGAGTAESFNGTTGVTVNAAGTLYVADYSNNVVRVIKAGVVTTLSSGTGNNSTPIAFNNPYGVALDAARNIYVANYGNSTITKIAP